MRGLKAKRLRKQAREATVPAPWRTYQMMEGRRTSLSKRIPKKLRGTPFVYFRLNPACGRAHYKKLKELDTELRQGDKTD